MFFTMFGYFTATFCKKEHEICVKARIYIEEIQTHRQMSFCLILVFMPADDGGEGSLHDSSSCPVCPLGAEYEDLARLLHVLLVHR